MTERVAVIGGARTPFAKAGTYLKDRTALELGTHAVDGALTKLDLDPDVVDQLVYGIVTGRRPGSPSRSRGQLLQPPPRFCSIGDRHR